jgi:ATP-dependent RNA helicase DDX27
MGSESESENESESESKNETDQTKQNEKSKYNKVTNDIDESNNLSELTNVEDNDTLSDSGTENIRSTKTKTKRKNDIATSSTDEKKETRDIQIKSRKKEKGYFSERLLEPTHLAESFDELNLSRPLLKAISELGYQQPTPIQQQTIPVALNGRDVCASAVTGSGMQHFSSSLPLFLFYLVSSIFFVLFSFV